MEMIFFLCLMLYCVILSWIIDCCPYYDEDRVMEVVTECGEAYRRSKAIKKVEKEERRENVKVRRAKRRRSKKLTKKQENNRELNEEFEYRFYMAVKTISPISDRFIEETFDRYRPLSLNKSYFDNLDAVALLELVEEEAVESGTHKHIAAFIRRCAAA